MRILLTLLTAISISILACGEATKAKRRERSGLSKTDYNQLQALNTLLTDNEDALADAFAPKASAISKKASEMAEKIKQSNCRAVRNEQPSVDFKADWMAVQHIEGPNTCPIRSYRSWEFKFRPDAHELWLHHRFTTEDKEFLTQTGIKNLKTGAGRIWVTRDGKTGSTKIQGGMKYDIFELADGVRLTAEIRTNQNYQGSEGRGMVSVTITQPGVFSHTGGITWDGRDSDIRRYYAKDGDIDREKFLELFSFFRLDEFVDNSQGMR